MLRVFDAQLNQLIKLETLTRVIRRVSSLPDVSNLIECDYFLRRYCFYLTGKESQLNCRTRHFATSPQHCRSWATISCQTQSLYERLWLRQRSKREAWACRAGVLGAIRWLWEHSGHSSSDNISGLIRLLFQMTDAMSITQRMVHTV